MIAVDRAAWAFAALLAGVLLQSLLHQPVGWIPVALASAVALIAALRPFEALLLLAALGPLSSMIFAIVRRGDVNLHFEEATALAFLLGFAVRRTFARQGPAAPPWLHVTALMLLALTVASGAVNAAIMVAEQPGTDARQVLRELLTQHYLMSSNPVTAAALFAQGLLLLLAVVHMCSGSLNRRTTLVRMMVVGAAAAGALNVLRMVSIAVAQPDTWTALPRLLATLRVNVHFGDLNAAGSYFGMAMFAAAGLWRHSRMLAAICTPVIAAAVWISGSRTAFFAIFIVGVSWGVAALFRSGVAWYRILLTAVALGSFAAAAALSYSPEDAGTRHVAPKTAWHVRVTLAKAALDMTGNAPVFGVGPGRYYELSRQYTLETETGGLKENAHNNFLQILAELGVPALALFLSVIALAVREGWRSRAAPAVAGLLAGTAVYLLTCIGGHPLLVAAAAYPFWIAAGALAAPTSAHASQGARELRLASQVTARPTTFLLTVLALVAVSLPIRIARVPQIADVEHAVVGMSLWQRQEDGSRYRWSGGRSAFFAPSNAQAVVVPLRRGPAAAGELEVRIFVDGREADRVSLESDDWRNVRLLLPGRSASRFLRIELHASIRGAPRLSDAKLTDSSGVLMVGRPEFEFGEGVSR